MFRLVKGLILHFSTHTSLSLVVWIAVLYRYPCQYQSPLLHVSIVINGSLHYCIITYKLREAGCLHIKDSSCTLSDFPIRTSRALLQLKNPRRVERTSDSWKFTLARAEIPSPDWTLHIPKSRQSCFSQQRPK
jgi:hypothetical protein